MTALETVKSVESRIAAYLFMDDKAAKKLLVAWTLYRPVFTDRPLKKQESIDNAYASLWTRLGDIDFQKLADDADMTVWSAMHIFHRLQEARAVYPDGTIAKFAQKLIINEIGSYAEKIEPDEWRRLREQERRAQAVQEKE